ncbi:unnamed protein product (macronuclear) [Paramecium tetraurelia]|uniref:G domain-containing protein n=1 Tax=Paramecium tetraurelia TaxID=5888 RepID=A0EGG1_PARTE|nr:uncharacterized protein GSPATT00026726001 [Paramecium tetraurelia]CAK94402.1 unnamed protein product [Paramecium tetraurelia]|eukprot:XP_001461775.1 hypothetical protein (macronuclear) [Paramecium tetraurelia strain d4-2]
MSCGCFEKPLSQELRDFLQQQYTEQQCPNKIIFTSNPESFKNKYNINKKICQKQKIYTIDQLASKQNVQKMIMSELEAEQFQLAYNYRNIQKDQFSALAYGNSGYTFRLELQETLNNGSNVLVIGEKGSGKSTLINAVGNSLLIDYADRYRYHIAEYDFNGYLQECDMWVENVKFKFLEVLGYGENLLQNQQIMLQTYEFLKEKNLQIDCILICRKFGYQGLQTKEKQIICHLAEVFGQQYIKKCFLVNTNYDHGDEKQILNQLQGDLNRINTIFDQMPDPKILFVNSQITPFEGNAGAHRFETVKVAKNAITNLINTNAYRLAIINSDAFRHRRSKENSLKQTKDQIKTSLIQLLPCLENYFQICEINENDDLFYANSVFWSTLKNDERVKESKVLSVILEEIILPDSDLLLIEKEFEKLELLNSLTLDFERQKRRKNEATYKKQFNRQKEKLTVEKDRWLQNIIELADYYINEQQQFLQETYVYQQESREQLITNNMNNQLKLYLQQDQGFDNVQLKQEFEVIRQRLFLPNTNLFATQIIAL